MVTAHTLNVFRRKKTKKKTIYAAATEPKWFCNQYYKNE